MEGCFFTSGCGDGTLVVSFLLSPSQSQLKNNKTPIRPWNLWLEEKIFFRLLKQNSSTRFSALPAVIFKVYSFLHKATKKKKKGLKPPSVSNGASFTNYAHFGKLTETLQVSGVKKTPSNKKERAPVETQTLSQSPLSLTGRVEYQPLISFPVQRICFAFLTFFFYLKVDEYIL